MKKITVAFDIDGTLRCSGGNPAHRSGVQDKCDETCQEPNLPMVAMARIFEKWFKNIEVHAWSGGGKDYTMRYVRSCGLGKVIPESRCHSKMLVSTNPWTFENDFHPDIAVDDIQDFELGGLNLIVRMK